jgi:methionine sulfoxide reductase heme-binding subunit
MRNKIIFWTVFIATLSLVPLTIFSNFNFAVIKHPSVFLNLIQRILGLTVFVLMFWQIIIGAYMEKFAKKVGNWIFNFHVGEGILVYLLIIFHPVAFVFFQYFIGKGLDPITAFLGICIFCDPKIEYLYTLGRIAFWFLTIGVLAGIYRWRKMHILNYLVFLLMVVHGFILGPDVAAKPFLYFTIVSTLLVLYSSITQLKAVFIR